MPLITPWQAQTSSFNHLLLLDLRQHQDISFGEFGPIGGIGSKPELPSPRGPARPIVSSPVPLPSTENEIASSLELDAEPFRPWLANLWRTEINLIWITTNFYGQWLKRQTPEVALTPFTSSNSYAQGPSYSMAYMQRILSNRGIFIADVKKSRQSINQWRSKFSAQKIITLSISKKFGIVPSGLPRVIPLELRISKCTWNELETLFRNSGKTCNDFFSKDYYIVSQYYCVS